MSAPKATSYTCFDAHRRIASGSLQSMALTVKRAIARGTGGPVLIFDDATGGAIDIDVRGSDEQMMARLSALEGAAAERAAAETVDDTEQHAATDAGQHAGPRRRGRPALGVVAREVTLLPRHWEWLAAQPGGASVALRKLVEAARRDHRDRDIQRQAQERAYRFMSAMAGDLPGYEEAIRALFADDQARFAGLVAPWPADVRDHALRLSAGVVPASPGD